MAPNSVMEGWLPGAQQRYYAREFSLQRENKKKEDHTENSKQLGVAGTVSTRQARTTASMAESHTNPLLKGSARQIKESGHNQRATQSR